MEIDCRGRRFLAERFNSHSVKFGFIYTVPEYNISFLGSYQKEILLTNQLENL